MSSDLSPLRPTSPSDAALPIDALAAPLSAESPCGPDLEYDPAFQSLTEAATAKPERQYGETVYPAEPPDWPAVRTQARALAERTRDLRIAVWLLRAEARVAGFVGAVDALKLLHALLDRHWADVHPRLDASDDDDPTARLNALFPLHHDEGLADLRAAGLTGGRSLLAVRALELVFGRVEPLAGEAVPVEASLLEGVRQAQAANPALVAAMQDGVAAARGIAEVLDARLGGGASPELGPLVSLLQAVGTAGLRAQGGAPAAPADEAPGLAAAAAPAASSRGEIRSRADAVRALERVCAWLQDNEPTHPAPILIERAQRLLAKRNFLEVIRDLVPEGIGEIEKLAGPSA